MGRLSRTTEKYIKDALRRIWGWDSERRKAKLRARIGRENGQDLFRCEQCNAQPLDRASKQIDHIVCVEQLEGFDGNWTAWIERLFCAADGLQTLCLACHRAKSEAENSQRPHRKKRRPK